MSSREEKLARLEIIRTWENPGEGSFYDDVGNLANSPHVRFAPEVNTDPEMTDHPTPTFWWLNNGKSHSRLSWQTSVDFPEAVVYEGLDPKASYVVRTTGYGRALLRVNGKRVQATEDGRGSASSKFFPCRRRPWPAPARVDLGSCTRRGRTQLAAEIARCRSLVAETGEAAAVEPTSGIGRLTIRDSPCEWGRHGCLRDCRYTSLVASACVVVRRAL